MKYVIALLLIIVNLVYAAKPLERVSLQLQWADQFQFAGYYVAKEKGYYRDAGLDVTLKPFNPEKLAVDEVLSGRSTYGIGRSSLLIDRLKGSPVVALAAIFQNSPFILLSDKKLAITTPKQLAGKRIMMTEDFLDSITVRAMLNAQNVPIDSLHIQKHSYNPLDIVNGKTDVMASYCSNEPFVLKEKGYATNVIDPADYGFDFYSDILFTSEKEVLEHPKQVEAFFIASLRGWEYAFAHIDETAELITQKYNTQNKSKSSLVYEGEVLKKLAYHGGHSLGEIEASKFERIVDIYRVMGINYPKRNIKGFVYYDYEIHKIPLTIQEHMFMHTHTIQAVSTDQWPPLNFSAKTPLEGIAVDVWREVCSLSGITQQLTVASTWSEVLEKIRSKSADVTLGTSISSEKEKYALFSKPYATFPNVIVTSKSFGYVPGLTSLNGKRIAIGVDYTIADQIAKHYPQIRIVDAKNTSDALAMLHAGQVDAVIDILPVVAYLVNTENYLDIQISGTTEFSSELRFMIRNDYPQLKSIIDKSIDAMSAEKKEMMLSRYIGVMYVHPTDYTWVYRIAGLFLFLFGVFIYRQLEMGKYNKKLLKMATTDPLTQLFNRIQLDEKLQESYATYQRTHRPFSIIMLDIDYFKRVNDTYGHLVGDKILVAFASILNNTTRDTDIVGRWGGEEFMIICPETDKKGALSVAEKVRNAVNEYDFEEIHTMTSSFGISEYQQHERIEKMVKRADDAMYTAKEAGRDRIVVL